MFICSFPIIIKLPDKSAYITERGRPYGRESCCSGAALQAFNTEKKRRDALLVRPGGMVCIVAQLLRGSCDISASVRN